MPNYDVHYWDSSTGNKKHFKIAAETPLKALKLKLEDECGLTESPREAKTLLSGQYALAATSETVATANTTRFLWTAELVS